MHENEQNRNNFTISQRALATYDYTTLWLHPWNDHRIVFFMEAVLTAIFIYDGDLEKKQLIEGMYNQLNQRLDLPLTPAEQKEAINLFPKYLGGTL